MKADKYFQNAVVLEFKLAHYTHIFCSIEHFYIYFLGSNNTIFQHVNSINKNNGI